MAGGRRRGRTDLLMRPHPLSPVGGAASRPPPFPSAAINNVSITSQLVEGNKAAAERGKSSRWFSSETLSWATCFHSQTNHIHTISSSPPTNQQCLLIGWRSSSLLPQRRITKHNNQVNKQVGGAWEETARQWLRARMLRVKTQGHVVRAAAATHCV